MSAGAYVCGEVRTGPGHPPKGWYRVHRAGEPVARWFCRIECLAAWAQGNADPADVERTARDLARAGGRPWLRFSDLTPARLRALMQAVADQAAADAAGHRYTPGEAARKFSEETLPGGLQGPAA